MVVRDIGYNHVEVETQYGTADFVVKDCSYCPLYPYQTANGIKFVECQNHKCNNRKEKKK